MLANPLATAVGFLFEFAPSHFWLPERDGRFSVARITDHLHLYTPIKASPDAPVLVFVHGGHGQAGSILPARETGGALSYEPFARAWATNGVTIALVGYPLCKTPDRVLGMLQALLFICVTLVAAAFGALGYYYAWLFVSARGHMAKLIIAIVVGLCAQIAGLACAARVVLRVAPVHLQTEGTTAEKQVTVVAAQIDALHRHLGSARTLTVAGHSHGALLAALALGRTKPDYVNVFVGIGGIYDMPALVREWRWLSGAVARSCYVMPVFGTTSEKRLQSLSPTHSPIRDETQVWLVDGIGESQVLLDQGFHLMRSLAQCRERGCLNRVQCTDKAHERRKGQLMIGPIGMGHGMSLLRDQRTAIALVKAMDFGRATATDKKSD